MEKWRLLGNSRGDIRFILYIWDEGQQGKKEKKNIKELKEINKASDPKIKKKG